MILRIILALTVSIGAVRAQMRCDTKADVTFLLDSSNNVGPQNFVKELNFVKDVSNNMQVAPDKVQVSALTFGTGVNNQFYLNQYTDNTALQQAITAIPYKGGMAKMPNAIRFATGTSFSPIHGGRGDAPHVAVLLTNQPSGTIDQVKLEAQTARDNGLILYTVGIGSGVDQSELQEIASQPDGRHMFQAQNFDALGSLSDLLATKICNELPPDPTMLPAPTGCLQKADVVFMVDSSSSVGSTNFQKMEHFLKDVVTKIDVAPNKVQVGLVQYSNYPSVQIPLGQYHTRPETLKAIEGLTYMGGATNDADALMYTSHQVFSQYSGARGDVPRIAVLITDGGSANPNAAVAAADKARQENIGVIAVGVGGRINHAELSNIANSPSSQNTFTVNSYNDLDTITDKLISQMCQIKSSQPSITTASPGATLPPDPCKDKLTNCAQYGNDVCTNYPKWANENCAKFCGQCTALYTNAPPKCQDTLPDCTNYGRDFCAQPGSFVAQNCQLFCGFCGTNTSSTGYYGKCSYKGKQYATGEKWYDACDYECICENGNTGQYKCNNRCPVYYNLPSDCTLVSQPGECCLQPVCNFNPTVNVQQSSGHGVTANGVDVCVYKGKQYFQRQSWRDGCDFQCTCTDAKSGLYRCEDLCPSYGSIPPYCHLEQAAGECCKKLQCEFDSQTGSFFGNGQISGNGVGAVPTDHPPCLDAISTCNMYSSDVCTSYRGWASMNCRKFCNMCPDGLPKPGPNDRCVYDGKLYKQGEQWNTGCDTQCTCENAIYGYYRCVNTCPTYNNLPKVCKLEKKAGQCCPQMQCVNGYFLTSSLTPGGTIGSGGAINVTNPAPGITYIAPTSSTGPLQPGTGGTGYVPPKINGCLYKGHIYVQGQAWEDGCEYSCVCKEASTGLYSCMQKCPTYPALAPSCHLDVDRNDECCKAPVCTPDPVTNVVPVPVPVFMPAVQTHSLVEPPNSGNYHPYTSSVTLFPTGFTPAPPTIPASQVGSGGIGYCIYRGVHYKQGQVWEDGCDFTCVCQDASRGHYQCTEKCVHYGVLPKQCYLIKDPANPCCDIPKCNFQVNFVTHVGDLGVGTTSKPLGEYCIYEGQQYQQGQTWYDGCSFKCTCEDASENTYRCLTRCPEYENVDENCQFLPDPKDPSCCVMPQCPESSSPGPTALPTPAPTGSFIGQGPGTGFCEYKGVKYTQGQAWQDGCDLNCVCADATTGLYKCTEICERYNSLPEYCTLVTDFTNPCCKKPRCNFPSVTSAVTNEPSTLAPTPPRPGETPLPNPGSTLAPHYKYCVYKNVQYSQGETWEDGCQYRCRCDDADKGLYVCTERCASYDTLAEGCKMVTDPRDSCCLVPSCLPPPQSTPAPQVGVSTPAPTPYQIPTVKPGEVTGSAKIPTPKPGMTPPPINYCEYKGQQYSQGQKWDDGCEFTCECVGAATGKYKCVEKCQRYVELPSNCRLAKDPANPCCQVPECTNLTPAPVNTPKPEPTTPKPVPQNVCVYKGKAYTQGQQWYDGCEYVCTCEDSMQGLYTCNERCPAYGDLPAECMLVPSSADPLCCKEPKCTFLNTKNQTNGYLTPPTPPPGVIYGGAATPTPLPTMAPSPGYSPIPGPSTTPAPKGCVYKGNMYQKGQKWQDGCDYTCECLDDMSGQYKCTEICAKMDDLPAGCRLITDSYNPCCKKAYCPANLIPTPAPPGVSTMAPTPQPKTGCMYNGVMFSQGQQWNDGCDLQCVCEDGMTGYYRCNDRCNKYDVPEGCELVTDPRDSCCKVPYCPPKTTPKPWYPGMVPTPMPGRTFAPELIPTPAPGSTYAPGMFPTWVPGMVPTPAPGYTFAPGKIPTPAPGSTYAPLQFPTWVPGMVPTPAPGVTYAPNKIPTPAPGRTYAPGLYPTYVPGMVPTPAPGYTYAPNMIPTPAPGRTYAPGMFPTYVPGMVPTPAPGATYAPWKIPTPAPGRTYAPGKFPTYVPGMVPTPAPGATYAPWLIPTPAPGRTYAPGYYPTYVPGMVPTPAPGYTYAPNMIPTPAPGRTYAPGKYPTYVPGMVPTPAPGYTYAPNMIPTPAPGRTYAPGKFPTYLPGMVPTPAPGYTYPSYLVPTPAPGQTYAPGKFPEITTTPYPTPAPGSTYPPYVPGMVPTPAPGQTYAPNLIPTPAPGSTFAPGKFPTWVPGMVPTPAPGKTFAPWLVPGITPAPGSTYAPFKYPTWVPGMVPTPAPGVTYAPNMIPTPAPGSTYLPGLFPTYVPGMVPTPAPGQTYAPNLIPTPAPGSTYAPGMFPTFIPGMVPTPAPGFTYAPGKIPTPAPGRTYAPFKFPTYVPGMVPTPAPGVTYAPNMIPTPAPGRTYAPGYFPTYVPGMVPTPAPGYTYAPNMIPTPAPGRTYAPGKFPTYIPGMKPTPAPGATFAPWLIPTPAPGRTYAPGKYPTWIPGMVPTPAPGMTYAPNMIPTPAPGRTYAPGYFPTYVPGMVPTPAPGQTYAPNLIPTPAPGSTYKPGMFPTYIPGMVPTPAPGVTYAPNMIPTPAPGSTYAPFQFPTWVPGMVPTPAPGVTYAPNKIPTPAPGYTYPPGKFPTYVPGMVPTPAPGQTYAPNLIPTPAPGSTYAPGMFPTYIPGMVPTPAPGFTYAPGKIPTPAPGSTYPPFKFPTYVPGMVPTPAPGVTYAPNMIPTPAPGRTYAPGKYPTYVPGMVPTPAPGYTYAPNMIPTPAPGRTYAPGKFPTYLPGMVPTPAPGYTYPSYLVPTPAPGQTYAPGKFPEITTTPYPTPAPGSTYPPYIPGMVPTPAPGQTYAPNLIPTPAPGSTFAPGKFPTWVPGMVPTPAPGKTFAPWLVPGITPAPGSTYAPFQYPTWVPGMVPTPAPGVTYAPNMIPTPAPGSTYLPGLFPTYVPGMVPTPAPGQTYAPNLIPTPAPGSTYAPGMFPTYIPGMVPTPAPGFTYAPGKIPTPAPGSTYAPFKFPTYVPGMVPTPAPGVTYAPNMIPTPAPGYTYAPGMFPTYVPGMVPTPAPGVTYAPNMIPTPAPGRTYAPGKFPTYLPGMVPTPAPGYTYAPNMIPTPAPGRTYAPGKFPTYLPGMVPTPAPGATYAPWLIPTPAPGRTYAPGKFPTYVPGMVPTPAPGYTYAPNMIPTPAPGRTYAPGKYPTYVPGMVPTPAPGYTYAPNMIPTPAPGSTYAPGKFPTYLPGMVPTPAPGFTYPPFLVPTPAPGQTYAPGKFPEITTTPYPTPAPGSTYPPYVPGMVPTPAPGHTYAPNLIPTPAPGSTYAPGMFPTWVPGMVPTPAPGKTFAPWLIPGFTPAVGSTYAPFKYPTYVPGMVPTPAPGVTYAPNMIPTPAPGRTYAPGMFPTWVPGMVPTPAPGQTFAPNMVPTPAPYSTYAPGKFPTWVPGMVPTPAPGFTYSPDKIPTPAPGYTYAPLKYPTWVPGMVPTPAPGYTYSPNKVPTPAPGRTYAPGMYPTYVPGMVPTPAPGYTYAPNMIPTPAPGMTYAPGMYPTYVPGMVPTPAPGATYAPWLIPTPAPGMTYAPGKFPTWVPGMVPTPAPGSTYAPNLVPTPGIGQTYAPGKFPTPAPSTVNPFPVPTAIPGSFQGSGVNGNRSGCVHYGVVYNAGQTWQDGCKYDCECLDDHTGRYECKERCPLFLNIPSYCRLVIDPSDPCCKIPECATPTPAPKVTQPPQPVVTPSPGPTPAPSPGFVPTPQPTVPAPTPEPKEGCVMNGVHYVAGQSWYEGCDRRCVCEDGKTHFYRCYDRCAKYPTVPVGCTMVPDPKDPTCCEVPQCIPLPSPGQPLPTAPITITGVPGVISGVGTPPTLVPGTGGFTSAPKNVCVYNGRMYTQGQKWQDGCKYDCICTDGMTGKYECTERCAAFPLVPPACQMKRSQTDVCCFVPVCDFNQTAPTLPPPVSPGISTQLPPLPPSYCVYKGVPYSQGQTWDDGCTKKCRCDDADNNIYTCYDRCKSYNNLGSGCVMVADPMDPCCQVPKCTYVPTPGPQPGTTVNPPTVCPYPMPTAVPGVINGLPQPNPVTGVQPSNVGFCEYKGTQYTQGQSWDDGCSYTCTCIDSSTGQYQCTEKCPRYVGIPAYCKMAQDPNNKCCTKPACNVCPQTPVPPTGPAPSSGPTTAPKPKEVCVMNGKEYTEGQKWYVGCEKICICDDGKTGAYSCNERCPSYPQQQGCKMVPDQRDPKCCLVPSCPTNAGVYGVVNGSGTPAPITLQPPQFGSTMVAPSPQPQFCVYKGRNYAQGQRWQDGCQYECVCDDAMTGHYLCTDRCPRYPNLPATCHLAYNPTDPCCQKPVCPNATPTPGPDGSTMAPQPTQPQEYCIYQGVPLKQGQTFKQGCDKICKCEDAMTGQITCDDRCPVYPALTSNCVLTTDPNDQCCQIPSCTDKNGVVTGVPGTISGSNIPTNNPYYPTGTRSGCVYNGQIYQQGQNWDDGCTYQCECLDASTGRYKCTEKCARSPPLPSYCTLTTDPNNKCCQTPYCQPPTLTQSTPAPGSTVSPNPMNTPAPAPNMCVYKGSSYQQGQQWYDGCDFVCRCDDASNNIYNCKQRCPRYDSIQPGCTLVADPADPTCCTRPSCPLLPPTGPSPTVGIITAAPYPGGVITGVNPTPAPGSTNPPPYKSGCVYKGQVFHQGQKWDDGCDYECECLDDSTGQYRCVEKCQKYSSIPNECVLVQDKNKPCCQVPYCDFTNPTPFPGGQPTPGPVQQPTPKPGVATVAPYVVPGVPSTPRPGVNTEAPTFTIAPTPKPEGYCVYKGVYYTQGQTWNDGCDKICRCEDVMNGYYTCNQRCASYPVSSCPLKSDPADACCLIPDCNSGSIPTPVPTPGPGQTTLSPFTPKPITGSFTGTSGGNPVVVPYQPGTGTSGSSGACIYKGMIYQQGQSWNDGCNYKCECIDAVRGQYKCDDRCPKYPYLPNNCYFKQSATDACCKTPECSYYNVPTTLPTITVKPGQNTGPSGSNPTIKPANVCLYTDGSQYAQGATWKDGCDRECTCTDSVKNIFTCKELCPVYSGLPSFCILVTDPKNTCCKMPQCTLPTGITLSPLTGNQTPAPNSLTVLPIGTHQVFSGYNKPQPGQFVNGTRDVCIYKGSLHTPGSSWDDGCQYTCTCKDGATGMYSCADKCPSYPTLPTYCQSVKVPGQCCPTVSCDIPGYGKYTPVPQLVPTPRPNYVPGASTPNPQIIVVPNPTAVGAGRYPGGGFYLPNVTRPEVIGSIRDKCVYKQRLYNQGEKWEDGCDYECECQDSRTGYYVCNPLCPVYNNLPSNQCYLVKADGQCCSQPMCYDPSKQQVVNPLNGGSFPVVGTYGGGFTGFRPNVDNGQSRNSCVYKGLIYRQNQKWDDGCDFACTCIDEKVGQYSCTSKCPTYTNIPPICSLVDQPGSCCKRIECPSSSVTLPPGPTQAPPNTPPPTFDPLCHDAIDNCKAYGSDACGKTYEAWARRNCNLTCGFCTTALTTALPKCEDKMSDCKDYGLQACSGIYEPWARDNCRSYCGLCPTSLPSVTTQQPTTPDQCVDVLTTCSLLDPNFYCVGDYYSWAMDNCKKTCNLCHVTTTPIPQTVTSTPKWSLLMKGVAGAQGPDLYQLWNSGQVLNPNVPQAQTLTASYPGHYKPDTSNHWQDYCFDKIKVAIYNNGIEKAFIIFNSTGADKNSWFTSDRIISSSWTDLQTAQKEIFSMSGDANTGREFYASGHSDPTDTCDSFGWMMISTKQSCFYEAGDKKPSFYYAPGTSLAHWGYTNPGSGDVFAIQGHAACNSGQQTSHPLTTVAAVCDYKGQQYTQGQFWKDGCQYNCSCEDASIGYYRCRNLCPQYTNLPPGCTLQKPAGGCCATPDCGSQLVSTIKPVVFVGGAAFCTYKGQYYTQDQTWNDGCSQSCTCTNADQGMYSCRAVCLNWNTLPSVCHLEDAPPGLCCQQPRCPSGIVVTIPKSYKDQYPGYQYV